jgi:molybdopterin molybdotransferase
MLTVEAARAVVLGHAKALEATRVPLSDALGLVLADNVVSDLDMPPFDKAMMDGYAVRVADLPGGSGELSVIEEVVAGARPVRSLGRGDAVRIMTGAPIPAGTDAVVPVEKSRPLGESRVAIDEPALRGGQHILRQGREMKAGERVLRAGVTLGPAELGVLATVGCDPVRAISRPSVAILATGDEIVDVRENPGPGQIRNSNGPMLAALAAAAGAKPQPLGIGRDNAADLRAKIAEGLKADVLVLSGGVSAGKLDLVPGILGELGVEALFHKVQMKPGKPVLFGVREKTLVYGLPGNPVSSFVTFALFVRPALRQMRGLQVPSDPYFPAVLVEDWTYRTDRPTFHAARLDLTAEGWRVRAVPWFGSADLRGLTACNSFILLPAGDHVHRAGQSFPVVALDDMEVSCRQQ